MNLYASENYYNEPLNSKKTDVVRKILIVLIFAWVAVAFVPCVNWIKINGMIPIRLDDPAGGGETGKSGFYPIVFCIVGALELLLICVVKKTWAKIAGLILNLFFTFATHPLMTYIISEFRRFKNRHFYYRSSVDDFVYVIYILGVLISIVYIIHIASKNRQRAGDRTDLSSQWTQ